MKIELSDIPRYCPCCATQDISQTIMRRQKQPNGLWEIASYQVKYKCNAELRIAYNNISTSITDMLAAVFEDKPVITRHILTLCPEEELSKLEIWSKENERNNL